MRRSRAWAVGLVSVLAATGLTGCAGTPFGTQPAPSDSASSSSSPSSSPQQSAPVWPDPALTVVTTPHGTRQPLPPVDPELTPEVTWLAGEEGMTLEQAAQESQDQETYMFWSERARALLGDRYSALAWGDPDDDSVPPWVAYTGAQPPEGLVALAEELPFSLELRGGAVLSDAERERVLQAGLDAFTADVGEHAFSSGGLDAPTGRYSVDYIPDGARKRADDATAAAMAVATVRALGRDAPITAEFHADDRDPQTTEPAVWLLPAGFRPDPAATSVEVLVAEQGCTSGQGAAGNTAEPVVEVTATQVRISVSTYIRKGAQACPNHPLAPLVVDLGQPLGDRELVDVNGHLDDDLAPGVNLYGDVEVPAAG